MDVTTFDICKEFACSLQFVTLMRIANVMS